MWLEVIIIVILIGLGFWSYKSFTKFQEALREIYGKFDTIYYMLCDIFKKRYDRSEKKRKK